MTFSRRKLLKSLGALPMRELRMIMRQAGTPTVAAITRDRVIARQSAAQFSAP